MAAVRVPAALRALEAWEVDSRAAVPLKINITQDWGAGSVEKRIAPHGLSIQAPRKPHALAPGAGRAVSTIGGNAQSPRGDNDTCCMKASGQGQRQRLSLARRALEAASMVHTATEPAIKTVCSACGVTCKEGHKFCVFCGSPVTKVAAAPPAVVAMAPAGVAAPVSMNQNRGVRNASDDGGGDAVHSKMSACAPACPPETSLARGLQMKPLQGEVPKRPRASTLTSLPEEEEDEVEEEEIEEEKEQEVGLDS